MCSPNDIAVLHAIFHPSSPFGDFEGQNEDESERDTKPDLHLPPAVLEQVSILERRGVEAAESGDIGSAVQRFSEAIALLPEHASAYNNRAQALRLQGDVTGALRDLDRALELSRNGGAVCRQALVQRALILRLQGDEEGARRDMQKAAELGSKFAKDQLVLMNPYAALCNSMLRDMVQKLSPSTHDS